MLDLASHTIAVFGIVVLVVHYAQIYNANSTYEIFQTSSEPTFTMSTYCIIMLQGKERNKEAKQRR